MSASILIAEDDGDIRDLLRLYLESEGYRVLDAADGAAALALARENMPDMAILDVMMPELNGYELTRALRKFSDIPILILSAKSQDNDKILGLNLGADAYITKPFHPLEVVAYVKAALRRYCQLGGEGEGGEEALPLLTVGPLELDLMKMVLRKNGEVVPLTPTELKIAAKLMAAPGRVYTKAQLYACIGGALYESDENTMMVHISNLRAKVEDDPSHPKYIKTVRGLGYKIEET